MGEFLGVALVSPAVDGVRGTVGMEKGCCEKGGAVDGSLVFLE